MREDRGRNTATRYVVSKRTTGLGDRIVCLAAAWRYARATGRTLVADWRHSRYSTSPDNLFPLCFEPTSEIAGVPFIGAAQLDLPPPPPWTRLARRLAGQTEAATFARRDRELARIRSGADVRATTVVFDTCLADGRASWQETRRFLEALRPRAHIVAAADAFEAERLRAHPWIALHVRHGNGGDIMGHAPSWADFDRAIERCVQAVTHARQHLGQRSPVLLCTDSMEVLRAISNRIPDGVICRPKAFRAPGSGELHRGDDAAGGRDDALVEMLLLARCDVLIRYPAGSFFSFYGAVMKPSALPRPSTIEDLQAPRETSDPGAPAVVF